MGNKLYLECGSGISGDMFVGAMLDLGADQKKLEEALQSLPVDGFKTEITRVKKSGLDACDFNVILDHAHENHDHDMEYLHGDHHDDHHHEEYHHDHENHYNDEHYHDHEDHHHDEHHHHEHRNLYDVNTIIDNSSLDENTKDLAKRIFLRVAKAESKVHNKSLDEEHFHEVGAIDSIVDIVGTAILINKINPDRIISSVVNDGYGFIECAHGTMAVPVPATSEIFAASNVKFRQIDIDTELVTPTGAAIIAELAEDFTTLPAMVTEKIGWGTGSKDLKITNVLKE